MNREIKFRVWDKQKKEFFSIKNGIILSIADTDKFVGLNTNQGIFWIPNTGQKDLGWDRWILQQFTNRKDKNGKDIYEGDIVNVNGRNHIIEWRGSGFYCTWSEYALDTIWFAGGGPVVVGNIYENPNLIK